MKTLFVPIEKPSEMNFILGQAHFIKTVEDIHESLLNLSGDIQFGLAFNEASGPSLVRSSGNNSDLIALAEKNSLSIGAGHAFILFLEKAFPINVLPSIKNVPEVCRIFCATANPTQVIVAEHQQGRGILGVIDGTSPRNIESEDDKKKRHEFLRKIGYKL